MTIVTKINTLKAVLITVIIKTAKALLWHMLAERIQIPTKHDGWKLIVFLKKVQDGIRKIVVPNGIKVVMLRILVHIIVVDFIKLSVNTELNVLVKLELVAIIVLNHKKRCHSSVYINRDSDDSENDKLAM